MKRAFGLVLLAVFLLGLPYAWADRHGACSECGAFVLLSEEGAGFVRDWVGLCGRCRNRTVLLEGFEEETRENEAPSDTMKRLGIDVGTIGGIRYLHFEDGTIIDLKHFMAAADVALTLGEVGTNVLGWVKEVEQWSEGIASGRPLGGNEDLRSNLDGADFGDEVLTDDGDTSLGEQILDYLEGEHGKITGIEQEKPVDRKQDGADVSDDEDD